MDNPETLATLTTQDTGRRQKQTHLTVCFTMSVRTCDMIKIIPETHRVH
jgi:hypothetical protein